MEQDKDQVKSFVLLNIKRIVTNLFKAQLETSAELNQIYLSKLMKNKDKIPVGVYNDLAWWDSAIMGTIRKKTLDKGNESFREIENLFDFIDLQLKDTKKDKDA